MSCDPGKTDAWCVYTLMPLLPCNHIMIGTVNTKMLLAGWSMCGIDLDAANDEFLLVSRNYVFDSEKTVSTNDGVPVSSVHGQHFVDCPISKCCPDVYNDQIRLALWQRLEEITGVTLTI